MEPKFVRVDPYKYNVSHVCGCGNLVTAQVEDSDVFKWRQGMTVQQAFPYLTAPLREALFISGVCPSCWDELWKDES